MSEPRSTTEELVSRFCQKTLPKTEWTHEAHLRVGLWHVHRHGQEQALALLRDRIKAFNEATGGVNTDQAGYHETITRFYVNLFGWFLRSAPPGGDIEELATEVVNRFGAKDLPLRWYSRERLFSVAARRSWVEPDLPGGMADGPDPDFG